LIESFVLVSLRGVLDIPAYVVCATYLFADLAQFLEKYVTDLRFVRAISANMIWLVIFYFVYEMRSVHLTLTSHDAQENIARQVSN